MAKSDASTLEENSPSTKTNQQNIDIDLNCFVPYLLDDLNRYFQTVLANALKPFDIIVPEWRVLICLNRLGSCAVNDIVKFTMLPQSTVSRTLNKLIEKGMVEQAWNADDNRVAEVRLLKLGKQQLKKSISAAKIAVQNEVDKLAVDEAEHWLEIMRSVVGKLSNNK